MNSLADNEKELATMLAAARERGVAINPIPVDLIPIDLESAYRTQHAILARGHHAIAGWKIGAKSPEHPIRGAPLPAGAVLPSPALVQRRSYPVIGLELEIAFRFRRRFDPSTQIYEESEVLDAIDSVCAAIEIVSSRFADWPDVDTTLQLADLQNHGGLVVGEATCYVPDYPFVAPAVHFRFEDKDVVKQRPANPAGDPRRLLTWVVNHCTSRDLAITPETIITTGSYTGMYFPESLGVAIGKIDGMPPVQLALT